MKKFALALISASAAVFGFGLVASAQSYDPAVQIGAVGPGTGYTVTYTNCVPGETITFTQAQSTPTSVTGVCSGVADNLTGSVIGLLLPQQAALPTAVGNFTAAPTTPGTYTGTAVGTQSPSLPFQFALPGQATTTTTVAATTTTVAAPVTTAAPGGALPATGSDGVGTTTMIALGLLLAGGALFVVAQVRRRQVPTPT